MLGCAPWDSAAEGLSLLPVLLHGTALDVMV
jgi:hypothetical protein